MRPAPPAAPPATLPPPWRWLATFFGAGLCPRMPGTCGSAAAALPLLLLPATWFPLVPLLASALATALSVLAARRLPTGEEDPPWFVLDEAAGIWFAAAALPGPGPTGVLLAFVLFRVFDILKPPPIRAAEEVGGGVGIVLDDLVAAGYALVLLLVVGGWMDGI